MWQNFKLEMNCEVTVSALSTFTERSSFKNVLIITDSSENIDSSACNCLNVDETQLAQVRSVASTLKAGSDAAATSEFSLWQGTEMRKVVICMTPVACSRHNTPARSHAVFNAVKPYCSMEDLVVLVVPSNGDYVYAQACAVGRHFTPFTLKSSVKPKAKIVTLVINAKGTSEEAEAKLVCNIKFTIDNIRLTQRLVDTPPNLMNTKIYVEECRAVAAKLGCQITVIEGKDLEAGGFGGIWGVGKASEYLPALVILSHVPEGSADKTSVCMVGKGIVYDTGGLSIKTPGTNMAGMKIDMGGSAAVLGAFATAVLSSELDYPLHGLLCIAENSVGPLATRPDDIHILLSGKSVEVNNTDAEGRLVLSDGVFYAHKNLNPRVIVDIATLTGAQSITTGKNHAAIFCNSDRLESLAVAAGKYTGDLTFPILYCPEFHRNEFRSQFADMKNSVADRGNAQASCAAQFIGNHLEEFLNQGGEWLHIDMAAPVWSGERATGYGVALLFELARQLKESK